MSNRIALLKPTEVKKDFDINAFSLIKKIAMQKYTYNIENYLLLSPSYIVLPTFLLTLLYIYFGFGVLDI